MLSLVAVLAAGIASSVPTVPSNVPRTPGWWNGTHFVWPSSLTKEVKHTEACWSASWQDHSCNGYLDAGWADNAEQCCTMCKGYKGCTYATYQPGSHFTCLAQPDWAAHGGQPDKNVAKGMFCMKM